MDHITDRADICSNVE